MSRVKGRTREQLKADRRAVEEAVEEAVRQMVQEGAMHGCGEHVLAKVDTCARCRWVNAKLGHEFEDQP
jgi:hypothetical protein